MDTKQREQIKPLNKEERAELEQEFIEAKSKALDARVRILQDDILRVADRITKVTTGKDFNIPRATVHDINQARQATKQ